jgi:endoglucanase
MMMVNKTYLILVVSAFLLAQSFAQGFLRTDGKKIVNDNGEVLLRSIGLGGWMVQEGYMLQTQEFANAQHEIRAKIVNVIGEEKTNPFYDAWLMNNCQKIDVDSIAAWGFNSIRLPMHYNLFTLPIEEEPVAGQDTWRDVGFDLVDNLLSWCAANEIYLILDLHAAPGGQGKDAAISDYDPSKPSLWESDANRSKTVALWRKLARRYADEIWIGGYDLINETNWNLSGNVLLKKLYMDITAAIRHVDTNHILFIEGNWWANDFTGLTPPWDDNMVYSFHKYWSHNDRGSIQWVLDLRNRHNVPLWCGESGENSNVWYRDAITLFEDNNIGWAWWPMKKVESISGIMSVSKPIGYDRLFNYWKGNASKPTESAAFNTLMELANNYRFQNCKINNTVIDAMIRQVQTTELRPFIEHFIPGVIFASDYDLGPLGYAYYDTEVADYHVSSGTWTGWNNGWAYRNDGVDVEECNDSSLNTGYSVGWISEGEWLAYTVHIDLPAAYDVVLRTASEQSAKMHLQIDGRDATAPATIPATGGWYVWRDTELSDVVLPAGEHVLKIVIDAGTFNLNYLDFIPNADVPAKYELQQNYPNPFNGSTTIAYSLLKAQNATLKVYDLLGKHVVTLVDRSQKAGPHYLSLNSDLLSSGLYFYRLVAGDFSETKKIVVQK